MKIAHFSDLHFSHFVKSPTQFFSKTWIGNANLLLKRGRKLQEVPMDTLLATLKEIQPELCLITGDFTTTSQPQEFIKAKIFVETLKENGYPTLTLPGNHDNYTEKAYKKKLFYHYLANPHTSPSLKEDRFEIHPFETATVVLLDLTEATPWFADHGFFHKKLEKTLENTLKKYITPLIFAGHFPIFKEDVTYHPSLKGGAQLATFLKNLDPSYYLHGHLHHFKVIKTSYLTQIDAGSLSHIAEGSFSVLDTEKGLITPYYRKRGTFIKGDIHGREMV